MRGTWTTDRLELRRLGPDDADMVRDYGLRSREFHAPWDPARPADFWEPVTVSRRLTRELQLGAEDRALVIYLTTRAAPDSVMGRVSLTNIVRGASMSCVAGYGLAPEATGLGYMTEALSAAVSIAFSELGLHRVEVNVVPGNTRSLAVAERCGFEREGFSPRFLRIAGVWTDHVRLARRNAAMETS